MVCIYMTTIIKRAYQFEIWEIDEEWLFFLIFIISFILRLSYSYNILPFFPFLFVLSLKYFFCYNLFLLQFLVPHHFPLHIPSHQDAHPFCISLISKHKSKGNNKTKQTKKQIGIRQNKKNSQWKSTRNI